MRKVFWVLTLVIGMCCVAKAEDSVFVKALIQVESGGNLDAIGDGGKAQGCLQIRQCVIDDVNKFYPKYYREQLYVLDDAFAKDKAIEICWLYLKHWGEVYQKKTGKKPTIEVYARIWNGGPNGWKKKSTLKYWEKVKKVMEKINEQK